MSTMASQITSLTIFTQSFIQAQIRETAKLRVTGLCEGNSPVNSPHKGPVTRKCFHLMTSSCKIGLTHSTQYPLSAVQDLISIRKFVNFNSTKQMSCVIKQQRLAIQRTREHIIIYQNIYNICPKQNLLLTRGWQCRYIIDVDKPVKFQSNTATVIQTLGFETCGLILRYHCLHLIEYWISPQLA